MIQQYTVEPEVVKLVTEIAFAAYSDAACGNNPLIVRDSINGQVYSTFRQDCCKYDVRTAISSQLTLH